MFNQSRIGTRYRSSHLCRLSPARYPLLCRLMPADHQSLRRGRSAVERHETPWNAGGAASPGSGHLNQFRTSGTPAALHNSAVTATSHRVTQSRLVRVTTFRWGRPAPATPRPADGSVRVQSTPLAGGGDRQKNRHLDQDRPLNWLFINVQKKGDGFAQKTQLKPTGFLWGISC